MSLIDIYRTKVSEDVERRLRQKVNETFRAYRHSWDVFSEIIQNSVDVINQRYGILNDPSFYLYEPYREKYTITPDPSYALRQPAPPKDASEAERHKSVGSPAVLRMRLRGADASPAVEGAEPLAGKVNYFTGSDRSRWRANVSTFARVKYSGVYPGVDVVYYGNQGRLEYDFHLAPGADPRASSLDFEGADRIELEGGNLVLHVAGRCASRSRSSTKRSRAQGAKSRALTSPGAGARSASSWVTTTRRARS